MTKQPTLTTREKLMQLYEALVSTLYEAITNPPEGGVKASMLAVARDILNDSGINARSIQEARQGLEITNSLVLPFGKKETTTTTEESK